MVDVIAPEMAEYALTLKQPWAYAVTKLGKRIDNRKWRPPPKILGNGTRIFLHAGLGWDENGHEFIHDHLKRKLPRRADLEFGAIVAVARVAGCVIESKDKWFMGPYGWLLEDVRVLETPIPAKGMLGLWRPFGDGDGGQETLEDW